MVIKKKSLDKKMLFLYWAVSVTAVAILRILHIRKFQVYHFGVPRIRRSELYL